MANGNQGTDLRNGNVNIAGGEIARSPLLRLISLGALKKWEIWSLDIKNASLLADGFGREVYARAPCEWVSNDGRRV